MTVRACLDRHATHVIAAYLAGAAANGPTSKEFAQALSVIIQALFVTVKAVEAHLTNGYRELGQYSARERDQRG